MSIFTRIASVLVATSIALGVAPAMADEGKPNKEHREGKKHFPMKADDFKAGIAKRLNGLKTRVEARMKKRNVETKKQAEVNKIIEAGIKEINAAADKAGADGVVTKDEAKTVREAFKSTREKIHKELGEKGERKAKRHHGKK